MCFRRVGGLCVGCLGRRLPSIMRDFPWPWSPSLLGLCCSHTLPPLVLARECQVISSCNPDRPAEGAASQASARRLGTCVAHGGWFSSARNRRGGRVYQRDTQWWFQRAKLDFYVRNAGKWFRIFVKLGGRLYKCLIWTQCSFGVRQAVEWLNCVFLMLLWRVLIRNKIKTGTCLYINTRKDLSLKLGGNSDAQVVKEAVVEPVLLSCQRGVSSK